MAPSAAHARQALTEALGSYFAAPSTDGSGRETSKKIVYLLDHEYTPKGVSWKTLKNGDRLRASALLEAAGALDLEVHLALADVQEVWNCEMAPPRWEYSSRRRYWNDYDDDEIEDEGDAELIDLIDDSITLKHWHDAAGKTVDLPEWYAGGSDILWTKANDELNPFHSEYEGWMGNYGNTMERWYHRAAIILWRRDEHHAALLKIAPEMMIRELHQLAEKKTTRPQAQEIIGRLLPNWSGLRAFGTTPSSFSRVFRLALRLDDSDLAQGLLLPLGIKALRPETAQAMARLQTTYGAQWLIDIIQTWLESPTYPAWKNIINKLSPMIKRWVQHAPDTHGELTHYLLGHQLSVLKQQHLQQAQADDPVTHLENAPGRIAEATDLLAASFLGLDNVIFNETIKHLIDNESSYLMFDLVEIARYIKQQDWQTDSTEQHSTRFLEFVRSKLTMTLDRPPRQADDWSIMATNRCDCADCQVLTEFLQSNRLDRKVWPLAKGRRQHIHRAIDKMGIPVTHKTERSGSPHKLHLKKTEQLFLQDQAQRARLKEALDDIYP